MTVFTAEHAKDADLLDLDNVLRTVTLDMTNLIAKKVSMMALKGMYDLPVGTLINTTIHGSASISQTLKVVISVLGPLGSKVRTLRLLVVIVANGELLADVALKVNIGPSRARLLLQANEEDAEAALAEFLLEPDVGSRRNGLNQHLDGFLDVVHVTLVGSLGQKSPSLALGLVGDFVQVDLLLFLAIESVMTLLHAVLADLWLARTITSLVALLVALVAGTVELARLTALGLGVALLTLGMIR